MPPVHRPAYKVALPPSYREGPREVTLYSCGCYGCTAPAFGCQVPVQARRIGARLFVVVAALTPVAALTYSESTPWCDVGHIAVAVWLPLAYFATCVRYLIGSTRCDFARPINPENPHAHR